MNKYQLDQTDLKILNLLQKDGLMTYKEMAVHLNKTHNPIVERLNRLKKRGYIKNTVALIDVQKVKSVFIAFPLIQLNNHAQESINQFHQDMLLHSEVMECYHVTGQYDFILKIVTNDMNAYNEFLRNKIGPLPYIGGIQSFLVLAESKHETAYPL